MKYPGIIFDKKLLEKLYSVGYIGSKLSIGLEFMGTTEIT